MEESHQVLTKGYVKRGDALLNTFGGPILMRADKVSHIDEIKNDEEFNIYFDNRSGWVNSTFAILVKEDGSVYFGRRIYDRLMEAFSNGT